MLSNLRAHVKERSINILTESICRTLYLKFGFLFYDVRSQFLPPKDADVSFRLFNDDEVTLFKFGLRRVRPSDNMSTPASLTVNPMTTEMVASC